MGRLQVVCGNFGIIFIFSGDARAVSIPAASTFNPLDIKGLRTRKRVIPRSFPFFLSPSQPDTACNSMNPGQDFLNKLAIIRNACGVSHAEFLMVSTTFRENNWYTDREIQCEVVGEPVAEYLKPFLPTITKQVAQQSLDRLLADGLLRRRSIADLYAFSSWLLNCS